MKTKATLTTLAVALALTALPSWPVLAQDLDLELTGVGLEVGNGEYRLRPQVAIRNAGNLASHALKIAMFYGPILRQEAASIVDYVQNHHTCWNYSWPNCGQGDCLEIYTFSATWTAECDQSGFFFTCVCKYDVETYFAWEPFTGEPTVTVMVDPWNEVPEVDEDNNIMTISLEPVQSDTPTWGAVKSLYR